MKPKKSAHLSAAAAGLLFGATAATPGTPVEPRVDDGNVPSDARARTWRPWDRHACAIPNPSGRPAR